MNRNLSGGFGSVLYAKEELRAELTSVAVGSMIRLPCDIPNHASYLDTWIGVLKQDRREIFHAAAEAQRMADYILSFHPDYAKTPSESSDAEDEGATSIAPLLAASDGRSYTRESMRFDHSARSTGPDNGPP